jgi:serine protease AprX
LFSLGSLVPSFSASIVEVEFAEENVSMIIGKAPGSVGLEAMVEDLGGEITAQWDFINSFAVSIPKNMVAKLSSLPGVLTVQRDQQVATSGTSSTDIKSVANTYNFSVRADKVWDKGIDGSGVTIAVVDSGITSEPSKTEFQNRIITHVKFNSSTVNMSDKYGHGTHVAGIIAGDGKMSSGKYVGIAPKANLINVKYSDDEGKASEQDLVNSLQWVYENRDKYNIRIVNISSNVGAVQSYKESATAAAVQLLWKVGLVVVASAGNFGGDECSTCHAPGSEPHIITVGAVDDARTKDLNDDTKTWGSSRGETTDGHFKLEILLSVI